MVADLWQRKVKICGCFKNSTSIVLQQCQKIMNSMKGLSHPKKDFTSFLKGKKLFPFIREHFLSFKNVVKILI